MVIFYNVFYLQQKKFEKNQPKKFIKLKEVFGIQIPQPFRGVPWARI
jgi:hypothetical protein